jgi:hypothetical protein
MKRKIIAILLATLMSATMFAGTATVIADEDEYIKEIKDHVTPGTMGGNRGFDK